MTGGYTFEPQRLWTVNNIPTFTTQSTDRSVGLAVVPVPNFSEVIPDIPRPFVIKVRGILRMTQADVPTGGCTMLMCIANAGTTERTVFDTDEMGLFPSGKYGNLDQEVSAYLEHEYEPHSPGRKQVYVGAHDNTSPGAFANPLTMRLMVAGPWGQARMSGHII